VLQPKGLLKGNQRRLSRVRAVVFYCYYLVAQTGLGLLGSSCEYFAGAFEKGGETYLMATTVKLNIIIDKATV
jgi:hypothetical protein